MRKKTDKEKAEATFLPDMPAGYTVTEENAYKAIEDGLGEIFGGYMKIFLGLARCSEEMRSKALSMIQDMEAQDVERPQEQENGSGTDDADTPPQDSDAQPMDPAKPAAPKQDTSVPPVTKDDLLREIQAKFREDRKNQEKIRSILLAYGASGLSLLPADKYADFLNDVHQL